MNESTNRDYYPERKFERKFPLKVYEMNECQVRLWNAIRKIKKNRKNQTVKWQTHVIP